MCLAGKTVPKLDGVAVNENRPERDRGARPPRPGLLSAVAQDYLKVIWTAQEWSQRAGVHEIARRADRRLGVHRVGGRAQTRRSGSRRPRAATARSRSPRQGAPPRSRWSAGTGCIETFLVHELGYGWDEVHDEAEVLEHAVSDLLIARIDAKLGHPERDPHGDPIPVDRRLGAHPAGPPAQRLRNGESPAGSPGSRTPTRRCCATSTRSVSRSTHDHRGRAPRLRRHRRDPARRRRTDPVELGNPAAQAIWLVGLKPLTSGSRGATTMTERPAGRSPAAARSSCPLGSMRSVHALDADRFEPAAVTDRFGLVRVDLPVRERGLRGGVDVEADPRLARPARPGCARARG